MNDRDYGLKWADMLGRYGLEFCQVSPKLSQLLGGLDSRMLRHLEHCVPITDTAISSARWVGPTILSEGSILKYSSNALVEAGYIAIARSSIGSMLLLSGDKKHFFKCRWMDSGFYYSDGKLTEYYLSRYCGFPWSIIRSYMAGYDYFEDRMIDSMNMP